MAGPPRRAPAALCDCESIPEALRRVLPAATSSNLTFNVEPHSEIAVEPIISSNAQSLMVVANSNTVNRKKISNAFD